VDYELKTLETDVEKAYKQVSEAQAKISEGQYQISNICEFDDIENLPGFHLEEPYSEIEEKVKLGKRLKPEFGEIKQEDLTPKRQCITNTPQVEH
jgi:hypothetical protein